MNDIEAMPVQEPTLLARGIRLGRQAMLLTHIYGEPAMVNLGMINGVNSEAILPHRGLKLAYMATVVFKMASRELERHRRHEIPERPSIFHTSDYNIAEAILTDE